MARPTLSRLRLLYKIKQQIRDQEDAMADDVKPDIKDTFVFKNLAYGFFAFTAMSYVAYHYFKAPEAPLTEGLKKALESNEEKRKIEGIEQLTKKYEV